MSAPLSALQQPGRFSDEANFESAIGLPISGFPFFMPRLASSLDCSR